MAEFKFNYLFLATAAVVLIAASNSPFAAARSYIGVNQFCRTSDYRRICTKMVKNATTWQEASLNAVTATLELAKRIQAVAPLMKPVLDEKLMKTCQDQIDSQVEDIETSFNALKRNDTASIHTRLGAALSNESCQDTVKESGVEFPLAKAFGYLSRHVDNSLAVVLQI
ncbi:hypothetical protein BUALT_Bualt05G0159700 [Buddleja alternifolia]|uniref:Pectinesterase inhibitor domain-containing protein n=1 Tax=Buddleja alternifolia TaxID=168488 RepID=A0AAV6XL22_9LAMI|nr:hypothetical protein BUALT_Bualt05G0159700 [Buddleja alternifolia]